ncbi:MAG: hypothetical protein ACE10K_00130 [Rhodothermales bacterium]
MDLQAYLNEAVARIRQGEAGWGAYDRHPSLSVDEDRLAEAFAAYLERLQGNYPFFHPHYAGQMLKPPHPVAVAGYAAALYVEDFYANVLRKNRGRPRRETCPFVVGCD